MARNRDSAIAEVIKVKINSIMFIIMRVALIL